MPDDAMWCLVMFDLPVTTKVQRREATNYRNLLLDAGFSMVQFSVYARYTPTGGTDVHTLRMLKASVPPGGKVRVTFLTDNQWRKMEKFYNGVAVTEDEEPQQLTIF